MNVLTEKFSDVQKSNSNSNDEQSVESNKVQETIKETNNFSEHQIKLLGNSFYRILNRIIFNNKSLCCL